MSDKIKVRRGLLADITILDQGEFGLVTDKNTVYIGTESNGNILLNPVQSVMAGYTLDGYLYPTVDNVHGLGTPDKRWQSVSIGPDSLHIISKDTDAGYSKNIEYRISIDAETNKLQFVSNGTPVFEVDPETSLDLSL